MDKFMKNARRKIIIPLLLLLSFAPQAEAGKPLEMLTIQLGHQPHAEFSGILLAKELGWYEEAGIYLIIKRRESDTVPIDEVLEGRSDVGIAEGDALIKARAQGHPVKAIATQFQKSPFCLISKVEKDIKTPQQLIGKRIGIHSADSRSMLKIILAHEKLQFEDIEPVNIGYDLQPFIDDEIDVFPGFMNHEALLLKMQGYTLNAIPAFRYGYDFYSGIIFVTEQMLEEEPELIRNFLQVTLKGWKAAFKNPEGTAQRIVDRYYPGMSVKHQTLALKQFELLATLGVGEPLFGFMQKRVWDNGIDILYNFKQIENKMSSYDLFTLELLEDISRQSDK
jgi:ABC-type nitrate/sulfonate/bicarbonate transport system substrate-binding protein